MDLLRSPYRLRHTIVFLLLLFGVSSLPAVQANVLQLNGGTAYLDSTNTTVQITGTVNLYPRPNTQYGTLDITLQDSNASITYLSAAIARHARFVLPDLQYSYTFNTQTGRLDITPAATSQPMLSLPVDHRGRTAPVRISGEADFKHLQVDAEDLTTITAIPSSSLDPQLLRFDVADDDANLLVTDDTGSLQSPQPRYRDPNAPAPLPVFIFDQNPSATPHAQANLRQTGSANTSLFVVDSQGQLRPALHSSLDAQVLYALLSHDQESFYVALDPGFDDEGVLDLRGGHTDTTRLVAQLNCALFEVSLQDNRYTCVDPGYLPVPITTAFRRVVSDGERRPIQLDAEGNLYYLGYSFERRYDAREEEYILVRAERTQQLRRYGKASGQVRDLSPDIDHIGQFVVLPNGSIVYTATNTNSLNLVSFVDGQPSTNTLSELRQTHLADVFFTVDEGNTVLFGASSGAEGERGIQFGQAHPHIPGARLLKQLNTSLFSSTDAQQPTPTRILMADDGYVYALFTQADATLQLFRILPYQPDPIVTLPAALLDMNMQISKGHLYYMEENRHSAGLFGPRHTIQVRRLEDGHTIPLLADDDWSTHRYRLFNWRISGDLLTFSAFNQATSEVYIGEINTFRVRRTGDPDQFLNLHKLGSARGAMANIRDIEVLRPQTPEHDYGGEPAVVEVFTDPINRYSVSVEFSKHMNVEDIDQHLQVLDTDNQPVDSLKVWQHRVVHLILDKDPSSAETIPLDLASRYTVTLPGGALVRDRYGWGLVSGIERIFTTAGMAGIARPLQFFNDTGIDWCAGQVLGIYIHYLLGCPVAEFPGQDGDFGRDALARQGRLPKLGGGAAGFDYTKLDADGRPLFIQDQDWHDGGNETDGTRWSCVRDNTTGLIWEVKINDPNHLRHFGHTYSWYNPDPNTNGGDAGLEDRGICVGSRCDTHAYVQAVNAQGLCGAHDWRMPTIHELRSLVHAGRFEPAIDINYFPHTPSGWVRFWSSSPYADNGRYGAWDVHFYGGHADYYYKNESSRVRLVRVRQ